MSLKNLMFLSLILCITLFGCGKKKGKDAGAAIDSLETASLTEESDDIFEEFYEDEKKEEKKEEVKKKSGINDFPTSSQPEFNPNGRYVVQVSCVLSRGLAQNVAAKLEDKGYPAYIAEVENPTPELMGTYYRIRIGGFTGVSNARDFGEEHLTRNGYEFWVDNRSNDNVGMDGYGLGESSGGGYNEPSAPAPESEPAPAVPAKEWPATQTTTPVEKQVTQPSTPVPVTKPPKKEITTAKPVTKTVQESAPQSSPTTSTSPQATSESTQAETTKSPPQPVDEWGETEDEWGADTTGW